MEAKNKVKDKITSVNKFKDSKISKVYSDSKRRYGAPKIFKVLRNEGETESLKRIQRRMTVLGIKSVKEIIATYEFDKENYNSVMQQMKNAANSSLLGGGGVEGAIHRAAGPIYRDDKKEECAMLLRSCYKKSIFLASSNGCKSIAFSLISAGVYGYPKEEALDIVVEYIQRYAYDMDVVLVLFDAEAFEIAKRKYQEFLK